MYRAGLESILGFKLQSNRLQIDPCVPRWWREFEITYRRGRAVYRIKVENPLAVSRGVVSVEVDGNPADGFIELVDDEKVHNVRIVMGEAVRTEQEELTTDVHG
jgi:cyclic beta-1,2-glucan synthetase